MEWTSRDAYTTHGDRLHLKIVASELLLSEVRPCPGALLRVGIRHTYTIETLEIRELYIITVVFEYSLKLGLPRDI